MEPKLEPKSALGGTSFTYFHPWVVKVAQVVPDGTQRLPRVPKDYQNGAKMLPKVMKTWPCRHLNNCDSPNGGPSSKLYIYIYTCSDKGGRKASKRTRVGGRQESYDIKCT